MQLAEEVEVSERTLRRAVDEGTLRGRRPSPRVLELPLSERAYVRRRWALVSRLRGALRTEKNVRFALLYGSAARAEDTKSSDIDLIVSLRDTSLARSLDLRTKLEEAVGRDVDVTLTEDAEGDPTFFAMAIEDGRVLVDRESVWPRLSRRVASLRRRGREEDESHKRRALARADRFLAGT